ncbi:helix-turn-helix transcriptional regulator [Dactylosporangium vinaceum]|uniref:Helix-turn-helix domain-containing protein n=1 Tax=Dactylosporangium vinaceum TaxID=53362 RepID=A0ABV5MPE3_9ACTN|nr:helix-turn-helix transcriptional regulator [Dactylosporangium vinaceum]UAB96781.1 helix-turn-helix transcriptional regulator [Dactylosporangium vinaceum]
MATSDSPAGAQRRLRLALRRARDAAGLTQSQVGEPLGWSLSKVQRIESGDSRISITDLDSLLRLLGVTEPDRIASLTADAKLARKRGWWDEARYRTHLTPGVLKIAQYEQTANVIRVFQHAFFPGLLQDEKYAEAILQSMLNDLPEETWKIRLEARMRRQEDVWSRTDPLQYLLILDELLLQRVIGNATIMVRQLKVVLDALKRPGLTIRLLPKEEALSVLTGQFNIYSFEDEENAVLYRELSMTDEVVYDAAEVGRYRQRFERMWELSLTREATVNAIEAQYASLRALLSRNRG